MTPFLHFVQMMVLPISGHSWLFWLLSFYLVSLALRESEPHMVKASKLFWIPLGLMSLKLQLLFSSPLPVLMNYLLCLLLGLAIGYGRLLGTKVQVEIFKEMRSIRFKGSYHSFKMLAAVFILQYSFALWAVLYPAWAYYLQLAEHALGLLCAGYFFGIAISYRAKVKNYQPLSA